MKMFIVRDQKETMCSMIFVNNERRNRLGNYHTGNDSLPIYEQIVREVKKAIIKKEIMPGDMMPSIRALARELEISVITTKRAYEELEKEQLIYSVAGKGFYVKARNRELLKEDQIRQIEEKMMDAVEQAKEMGVSLRELKKMLEMFYVGGR